MPRPIWSGSISFGLVNIPVKLVTAIREEPVRFHMLHDQDKARLQRKMVSSVTGKEVHAEHTVKGYELAPDQYVILKQEELDSLAPEKSRAIEIEDFVDLHEIDPIYFDRPYYLIPDKGAGKSYRLLVEAMEKVGRVAIARFVMRNKEYLAAIRPVNDILLLETMHFGDEVVKATEVAKGISHEKVADRELKAAERLIESLTGEFKADQYRDEYKARVLELVERKAKGEQVVAAPARAEKTGKPMDLMAALEASVAKARGESNGDAKHKGHTTHRRRKSA